MNGLIDGINQVANYMSALGLAISTISIIWAGIKFFAKGQRQWQDFAGVIGSIVIGIFLCVAAPEIKDSIVNVF